MTNYSDMSKGELISLLKKRNGPDVQGEPMAYAVFADNGNIRIWCADPIQAETLRQEYGDQVRPLYAAPQPAPTAVPSRDVIRATLMAHGFTVKIGQSDLKPYVYEAVEALFAKPAPDVTQLVEALEEARDLVESWSAYASDYFKEKHNLARDLERLDAVIAAYRKGGDQS